MMYLGVHVRSVDLTWLDGVWSDPLGFDVDPLIACTLEHRFQFRRDSTSTTNKREWTPNTASVEC